MAATPPAAMRRAIGLIDAISLWTGRVVACLILPMVAGLTWEVVARYGFNAPTVWAYDMTFMLYGSFFMIGSAFTLQRKGHIRTDSFYAEWSPRRQAWVDLICYVLMFLPFAGVFAFVGWGYFVKAYVTHETFVSSSWQPITWPFKLSMPVAGALLLLQGVSECLKCLHAIRHGAWPDPPVAATVAEGIAV